MTFAPLGERARWRIIYDDHLTGAAVNDIIRYEDLAASLHLDPVRDRHAIQMALRRATRTYQEVDRRAVQPIPNVGYRVVQPAQHLELARHHQGKAVTQLERGWSVSVNVDLSDASPETRRRLEMAAASFAFQLEQMARVDIRQDRFDRVLKEHVRRSEERAARSESEINALKARLEQLVAEAGEAT